MIRGEREGTRGRTCRKPCFPHISPISPVFLVFSIGKDITEQDVSAAPDFAEFCLLRARVTWKQVTELAVNLGRGVGP